MNGIRRRANRLKRRLRQAEKIRAMSLEYASRHGPIKNSHGSLKKYNPTAKGKRIYSERDRVLLAMGFKSYKAYLESDTWKCLRAHVLNTHPKCFVCEAPATQVHHTVYTKKVLEGKSDRGLLAVCAGCHFNAEFRDHDHLKLNPKQATAKMKYLRTMRKKAEGAEAHAIHNFKERPTVDDEFGAIMKDILNNA